MRMISLLVLVAVLLVWLMPFSVAAHAEIVSSTPEAGSTLDAAPEAIIAAFSQKLVADQSSLRVLDAQGARVDTDSSALDPTDSEGKTLRVSLRDNLPAGTYTVEWATQSAEDGEATDGQFQFTIRAGAAAQPSASASAAASVAASARPSASASARASAGASASASAPSTPSELPRTGAAGQAIGVVAMLAAVMLMLSLLLRRGLKQ